MNDNICLNSSDFLILHHALTILLHDYDNVPDEQCKIKMQKKINQLMGKLLMLRKTL